MAGNPNWTKGKSGNPGGRSKALVEVKALAQQHTESAVQALADIVLDTDAPPAARVAAASVILDRGWGKPTQQMDVNVKHNFVEALRELERIRREHAAVGTSVAEEREQPAAVRH